MVEFPTVIWKLFWTYLKYLVRRRNREWDRGKGGWREVSLSDLPSASVRLSLGSEHAILPQESGLEHRRISIAAEIWHFSCFCLDWNVALNSHTLASKSTALPLFSFSPWESVDNSQTLAITGLLLVCVLPVCVCLMLWSWSNLSLLFPFLSMFSFCFVMSNTVFANNPKQLN